MGCGTGAILKDTEKLTSARLFGLDINYSLLSYARGISPGLSLFGGNAYALPFPKSFFDFSFCHFLLLWVKDPLHAVQEMRRVTRPGGVILALAEPDYGGRIDYPLPLDEVGRMQSGSLESQGTDPQMGRKLAQIFHQSGLLNIHVSLLTGEWGIPVQKSESDMEWKTLENDLTNLCTPENLRNYKKIDQQAWENGIRILFVPTFFAWGIVP